MIDDHVIGDIIGFATTIAVTITNQIFVERRADRARRAVAHTVVASEAKIATALDVHQSVVDGNLKEIRDTATANNKSIAVVDAKGGYE
jgi:hypothetical protein